MLAAMLVAGSVAGPVFAAENSSETGGTEQTSEAVFDNGTGDESTSADDAFSEDMSEEAGEALTDTSEEETDIDSEAGQTQESAEAVGSEESQQAAEAASGTTESDQIEAVTEENQEQEQTQADSDAQNAADGQAVSEDLMETEVPAETETISTEAVMEGDTETDPSGTCGDNLSWTLDSEGTLTISGTGGMENYSTSNRPSWYSDLADRNDIIKVIIESGVTSIGDYAFSGCGSLESVTIPEGVTSIGRNAFGSCKSLTNVSIPEGVTSLGQSAFTYCDNLISVTIPEGITSINTYAFYGCSSLKNVTIPEGATEIGFAAFYDCSGLESVTIPNSVTSIGERVFYGCRSLTDITLPKDIKTISSMLFEDCSGLKSVIIPDGVTSIDGSAFLNCTSLESVIIPDSVTNIANNVFTGCSSLESITIPDSVTQIDAYTFENCTGLKNITISKNLKTIGICLFQGCSSLESVTIPDGVTGISMNAFSNCRSLKSVTIPDSVTSIGMNAFTSCVGLTEVSLSKGIKKISWEAFSDCRNLTDVTIPEGVTWIDFGAFSGCSGLESVTIPNSVTKIEKSAFSRCTGIKDVFYYGTEDEWKAISISSDNDSLLNADIHYITVQNIENAVISGLTDRTYNGSEQTQTPVVKLDETTLTEGTDYTVSYENNTNAGTATVIITGTGEKYEGTVSAAFTIAKAEQSFTVKAAATGIDVGKTTRVTASGARETTKYTFSSSNTKVATVAANGTVTGKAAGTVTITVKTDATANYNAGSKTVRITVNKVLKKPGNCHFAKWNNSKYTSCRIAWNRVDGAEGYETLLSWTNGSNASRTIVKSNVLYRDCTVHPQHVSQMQVRAFYTLNGQRKYSPWSNVEYITPSPTKLTAKNASAGSNLKMNISWNIVYGCNGYNVFITTNPNGKWYWNQSTSEKATATSASIVKCGGTKLKKNTRYYIRIVTRRKRNGVFCTVPMPASNTNIGSFVIK